MKLADTLSWACFASSALAAVTPYQRSDAFESVKIKRQEPTGNDPLTVDLGYSVYKGYLDSEYGLNTWRGIRYAAPPTGQYRWQPPRAPAQNRSQTIMATELAEQCPQGLQAPYVYDSCPDLQTEPTLPDRCLNSPGFAMLRGNEDCLFLSVYAPANKTNLPVLMWIHGGGYGIGNGSQTFGSLIANNNHSFVAVAIQYRLGAFGFLAGDEVHRNGSLNNGLLDQHFAMQWIQTYISQFGGDPRRVTIGGESAGGGSTMQQIMAYGGTQGTSLFRNAIAASPYTPGQWNYNDWVPSQAFYAFAAQAGCFPGQPYGQNTSSSILSCLRARDTNILQQVNAIIQGSGLYGTWSFLPVTDGSFVQDLPSQQLLMQRTNGANLLVASNSDDGFIYVPPGINTEADFLHTIETRYPLFTAGDVSKVLQYYPSSNATDPATQRLYGTNGIDGASALNESALAAGQYQRAANMYAETAFYCGGYWLAEAFAQTTGKAAWKYQYSLIPGFHTADLDALFGIKQPNMTPDFLAAVSAIWANFIVNGNPSIPAAIANGNSTGNMTAGAPGNYWPQFELYSPNMLNLNMTGGTIEDYTFFAPAAKERNVTGPVGPGLKLDFEIVNALTWEDGRGPRCDFWRAMGRKVPS